MSTPTLDTFLAGIADLLRTRNATQLRDYLLVEPPLPEIYSKLVVELRRAYPDSRHDDLDRKCSDSLPEAQGGWRATENAGGAWPGFIAFFKEYLIYLRDVNFDNLLKTHELLSGVVNQCITALSNASMGIVVLPTCLSLSAALAKLAVSLDKRPDLTAHLVRRQSILDANGDSESLKTLVEDTAELLQRAFTTCLAERSASGTGTGRDGRPEGRKVAIYSFANLVLRLLFQCRKTRLASQIFTNIAQHSPPLSIFPASQRVTYLYYLGRFHFSTNHFHRAQLALEGAYRQCHTRCFKQRHLILTYLVAANVVLGRFPSHSLLQRPEAVGLGPKFWPVSQAIIRGDMAAFRSSLDGKHQAWFMNRGLLLPLRNRGEVLVWRTLARKTFLLNGVPGEDRRAPTLSLNDLHHLAQVLEQRYRNRSEDPQSLALGRVHTNSIFLARPAANPPPLSSAHGTELEIDSDLEGGEEESDDESAESSGMTMLDIEAIVASLIDQGLLHGFLSHRSLRFAILGAKSKGALNAGFPTVWPVLHARARKDQVEEGGDGDDVPGWVKDDDRSRRPALKLGPGMVVNLSGARPAGAPPA